MRSILLTLLMAAGLAACASAPDAPGTQTASGFESNKPLTGSRLMMRSTDRNVRVIGQDDARTDLNNVRSLGNEVGARGN